MARNIYADTIYQGDCQGSQAPATANSFVRKTDVASNSYITSIAGGSSSLLSVSGGALSVGNLLISDVTVDSSAANLAAYVSASYTGSEKQKGDIVILSSPTPSQTWIHNGGTANNASDFTQLNTATDYTAGTGLTKSGAQFSIDLAAGTGIGISGNTISANLAAGTGIGISGNTISHSMTAGSGLALSGAAFSADYAKFRKVFSSQNLSANTAATLTHNLGQRPVHVTAMDSSNNEVVLQVVYTSTNAVAVTSADALNGLTIVCSI